MPALTPETDAQKDRLVFALEGLRATGRSFEWIARKLDTDYRKVMNWAEDSKRPVLKQFELKILGLCVKQTFEDIDAGDRPLDLAVRSEDGRTVAFFENAKDRRAYDLGKRLLFYYH